LKRNVLTVFLAAPSDLSKERELTREAVDRLCRVLGNRLGWHIELLGWEDTLPGFGRPQSLINRDVDNSDLFIGLLWRRWGQPTGEKYDSGFYEEFIRARDRYNKTGKPEIWLFFKSIDSESLNDPGEQLAKVLKFKKEQIDRKDLFFKEFYDDSWENLIYDCLTKYIIDLSQQLTSTEILERASLVERSIKETSIEHKETQETTSYPNEIVSLFDKIYKDLSTTVPPSLDSWERTRLLLQSTAWFSQYFSWKLLGNHEINRIYNHRKDCELSFEERLLLVRSSISDRTNLRPGWFWLNHLKEDKVDDFICYLAEKDSDDDVRRNSYSLLAKTNFVAPPELIEKGLSETDDEIKHYAINLIKNTQNIEYIDLLKRFTDNPESELRSLAINAKIELIYQKDPDAAFSELISSDSDLPPLILNTLEDLSLKTDHAYLFKALEEGAPSVRRFAASYLRKSKLVKPDLANTMLKDTDPLVRKEGVMSLIELGEHLNMDIIKKLFPEPSKPQSGGWFQSSVRASDFTIIILRGAKPESLLNTLDFYSNDSDEAYRVLAEDHFQLIKPRIRSDLDDEFETLRLESESKMLGKYGDKAQSALSGYSLELISFVTSLFVKAALSGLTKNGIKNDIKYARKYLGNTKYNMADNEAISIISRFGHVSDTKRLIQCALNNYGTTKKLAIYTALDLSNDKIKLIKTLLKNEDREIVKIASQYLSSLKIPCKENLAKNLLFSELDEVRLIGLGILIQESSQEYLEEILDDYISKNKYYYNVVTWLDKCLYAVGRYHDFFMNELIKKLEA